MLKKRFFMTSKSRPRFIIAAHVLGIFVALPHCSMDAWATALVEIDDNADQTIIVSLKLFGNKPILTGILNGNATVTDVTTGKPVQLNLQDPDSMIVDPLGELVMTSQGDGEHSMST